MDAVGAEGLGRERGRERRVDAAGDADHDLAEAVLLNVVAQAELEAEPHLLEVVDKRGDRWARGRRLPVCRRLEGHDRRLRQLIDLARERAASDVAKPARDHRLGLDVDDEERLLEPRGAGDDLALVVEDDRVAVEDELVLSADRVAKRDERGVVAGPRREHLLPLPVLADVERRGRHVDEQLRSRERQVARRGSGLPHVLADRDADDRLTEPDQDEVATGWK